MMKLDASSIITIAVVVAGGLVAWGQFQAHMEEDQKQIDGIIAVVRINDQRIDDLKVEVAALKQKLDDLK